MLSFAAYFIAIDLILSEFGISLTAYIASASIIGFAVAFGSQGIVQDVVSGLTIIFTGLFDIGDMVEISGQAGIVKRVSMRFTIIENALGAEVHIPNRSLNHVINYPKGYVRCIVDVTLSNQDNIATQQEAMVYTLMQSMVEQFPDIFRRPPDIEGKFTTSGGRTVMRVKFRIWPGRGTPIENQYKQELLQAVKKLDDSYAEWMLAVNYEVELKNQ
ncbi:mechanosensitive ion channel family protein [Kaarinaea lacus]